MLFSIARLNYQRVSKLGIGGVPDSQNWTVWLILWIIILNNFRDLANTNGNHWLETMGARCACDPAKISVHNNKDSSLMLDARLVHIPQFYDLNVSFKCTAFAKETICPKQDQSILLFLPCLQSPHEVQTSEFTEHYLMQKRFSSKTLASYTVRRYQSWWNQLSMSCNPIHLIYWTYLFEGSKLGGLWCVFSIRRKGLHSLMWAWGLQNFGHL